MSEQYKLDLTWPKMEMENAVRIQKHRDFEASKDGKFIIALEGIANILNDRAVRPEMLSGLTSIDELVKKLRFFDQKTDNKQRKEAIHWYGHSIIKAVDLAESSRIKSPYFELVRNCLAENGIFGQQGPERNR